jgi:hypothetical protein
MSEEGLKSDPPGIVVEERRVSGHVPLPLLLGFRKLESPERTPSITKAYI